MVKNHLSKLLGERRYSQAELARVTGIRPGTVSELFRDQADRISFDHLNKICEALDCSVADVFEYIPDNPRRTGSNLIVEEHGNRKTKS